MTKSKMTPEEFVDNQLAQNVPKSNEPPTPEEQVILDKMSKAKSLEEMMGLVDQALELQNKEDST